MIVTPGGNAGMVNVKALVLTSFPPPSGRVTAKRYSISGVITLIIHPLYFLGGAATTTLTFGVLGLITGAPPETYITTGRLSGAVIFICPP